MSLLQAIVYGIIHGLTEVLPISSTAHLPGVSPDFSPTSGTPLPSVVPPFPVRDDPVAAFSAVIQIGTLLAALAYFRNDVLRLSLAWARGLLAGRPVGTHDAKLAWMIVLGTVPVVVCGVLLKDYITGPFRSLYVVAGAAVVLALLLMLAELTLRWRQRAGRPLRELHELGWSDALVVGLAQALALVPGASRSGVTITGSLFAGMSRETAARFSFLLSLPAVFAAGVYELYKER